MTSEDKNALVDQADDFAARVIRHTARRAPHPLNERLEEEWLADLAERRGHWQRMGLTLGCLWATRIIAAERVAAASAPAVIAAHGSTESLTSGPSPLSRRTIVLLMIVSIHALLLYGLISGLATRVARAIITPTTVEIIHQQKIERRAVDPLVPHPDMGHTRIDTLKFDPMHFDDVAEPAIIPPGESGATTIVTVDPPPPPPAVRRIGGPGPRFPATEDFYPAASRRAAEQGMSTVRVCVDAAGKLTGDPRIAQSSGVGRLDEGALRLARAGSGYYRSTLVNGHPIADCYPVRVHFILN
ncbi:MAG TPA: energy transducer TonB [Steroidobacteraceae bacterium]|jgi:protein TonB|nr:energy transducer TonB [Steroidobacteraceae bacterium]